MHSLTMPYDLTIPAILRRTLAHYGDKPVVSRRGVGAVHRTTYAAVLARAARLGGALRALGVRPGDAVATLCWNHDRHLEAYFGVPAIGAVLHTLNLRLHPDELAYIATDAGDKLLLVDEELLPLLARFRARAPFEHVIVVRDTGGPLPDGCLDYEALLAAQPEGPLGGATVGELDPAAMCYTSGTTGQPKGVVYSHRAIAIHSLVLLGRDSFGLGERDVVLPAVAMFHANAWGIPYAAALTGSTLVLPGRQLDAESLLEQLAGERVTFTAGVPTIWLPLLELLDAEPGTRDLSAIRTLVIGGAALPEALLRGLDRHGIHAVHSWGMTELAPVGTLARLPSRNDHEPDPARTRRRVRQGMPGPFLEIRARGENGLIPWDDTAVGELEVRGPWVSSGYHGVADTDGRFTPDGWFRTGDVVSIDPWGSIQIRDRAKDLVKSGGEWISSVALENRLMCHPAVLEAAVVAVPHPAWLERPLAAVVLRPGRAVTDEALREWLAETFPRWWLPEAVVFIEALPRTSTGKFLKRALRDRFATWYTGPATA